MALDPASTAVALAREMTGAMPVFAARKMDTVFAEIPAAAVRAILPALMHAFAHETSAREIRDAIPRSVVA